MVKDYEKLYKKEKVACAMAEDKVIQLEEENAIIGKQMANVGFWIGLIVGIILWNIYLWIKGAFF